VDETLKIKSFQLLICASHQDAVTVTKAGRKIRSEIK
jgi:hypothetical protein